MTTNNIESSPVGNVANDDSRIRMDIQAITPASLRTGAAARTIYQQQLGPVLCSLQVNTAGEKLAKFTTKGNAGWFVRGGFDLQQLWPSQVDEALDMGRNLTTTTAGGVTLHTMEWSGAPAPVHIIETPEDGAFMLFPPGCFEGHADTHDAAIA